MPELAVALTTNMAEFIEGARAKGELYIGQPLANETDLRSFLDAGAVT